jgi:excisionase family DNA binding protein
MRTTDLLTPAAAARLLGVSRRTLSRMLHAREIPGTQTPGGHWRVPRAAVLARLTAWAA